MLVYDLFHAVARFVSEYRFTQCCVVQIHPGTNSGVEI